MPDAKSLLPCRAFRSEHAQLRPEPHSIASHGPDTMDPLQTTRMRNGVLYEAEWPCCHDPLRLSLGSEDPYQTHTPSHKAVGRAALPLAGVGRSRGPPVPRRRARAGAPLLGFGAIGGRRCTNTTPQKPLAFCRVGLLRLVLSWARHVCLCGAAALGSRTPRTYAPSTSRHATARRAGRLQPTPRSLAPCSRAPPGPLLTHAPTYSTHDSLSLTSAHSLTRCYIFTYAFRWPSSFTHARPRTLQNSLSLSLLS